MRFPSKLRTPVGAATLSFVLPGLGQWAAGDGRRGAIVAIPAFAMAALLAALLLFARHALLDNATNQQWLTSLMLLNIVGFVYHCWAMADAYLLAGKPVPRSRRTARVARREPTWTSVAAVVVLACGPVLVHGAFAVEDLSLQGASACLNSPIPCWMLGNVAAAESQGPLTGNLDQGAAPTDTPSAGTSSSATAGSSAASASPVTPPPSLPAPVIPPMQTTQNSANWNADHMLNLLLVGMDSSPGRTDTLTDTMILLQVNTSTGQSAMYGIARNMFCMPLPSGIAGHFPNPSSKYTCPPGTFTSPIEVNGEVNALFYDAAFVHRDWYPGFPLSNCNGKSGSDYDYCRLQMDWGRGTFALEQAVGALTGVNVDGSAIINLPGFARLVDDLGGIDVNVPVYSSSVAGSGPVSDYPCGPKGSWQAAWHIGNLGNRVCTYPHNGYPVSDGTGAIVAQMKRDAASSGGKQSILWQSGPDIAFTIQTGQQHMDGEWALAYARSREYSSDYDRMARQQFVLRTIGTQVKACSILPRLLDPNGLLHDIGNFFWTDMPTDGSTLTTLAGLAQHITGDNVQKWYLNPGTLNSPSGTTLITKNGWSQAQYIVKHGLDKAVPASGSGGSGGGGGGGFGC
jgi:anionic cell wall polymer biosynthesis LytR-Cps2A-Psr (LCP) family protein